MTRQTDSNVVALNFGPKTPKLPPPAQESVEKFELFSALVSHGAVMVSFKTKATGVVLPSIFDGVSELSLNFCHEFRVPDFCYDEYGVRATLSFDQGFSYCNVPWNSVFSLHDYTNAKQYYWPKDMPAEMEVKKLDHLRLVADE